MFPVRKHITAFGLLLLLAIPFIFSVTVAVKHKVLQLQRGERLETETLQTIKITADKVSWIKQGEEAIINGELFDVRSYSQEGDQISLTGFFDQKEENLVQHIKNIAHQKNSPNDQLAVKFLMLPVYHEPVSFSLQDSWRTIARQFSTYTEVIHTSSYSADTPPPRA